MGSGVSGPRAGQTNNPQSPDTPLSQPGVQGPLVSRRGRCLPSASSCICCFSHFFSECQVASLSDLSAVQRSVSSFQVVPRCPFPPCPASLGRCTSWLGLRGPVGPGATGSNTALGAGGSGLPSAPFTSRGRKAPRSSCGRGERAGRGQRGREGREAKAT